MAFMDWIGKNIKFITEKELTNMPKKRFNIDEYPGKYAMYCETKEELFKFYDYLYKVGRRWSMGQSYKEFRPTKTVDGRATRYIYFNNGLHGTTCVDSYIILNFKDFDWSDFNMKETKFKVGDKVRVKNDLKTWRKYGDYTYTEGMRDMFDGKVATIAQVDHGLKHYHLAGDIMCYCWTDEMLELAEENQFAKADLKNGMIIEHRDGDKYMVIDDRLVQEEGFFPLSDYNDDLTDNKYKKYDIVKVYKPITDRIFDTYDLFSTDNLDLIWEREEVKEMTVAEIEEKLGYKVKVISDKED